MGLLYDYHVMLTIGCVKVPNGYVKKAHMKSEIKMLFSCFLKNLLLSSQDDPITSLKRIIVITMPASMGAIVVDSFDKE